MRHKPASVDLGLRRLMGSMSKIDFVSVSAMRHLLLTGE
jgi:hypothetical protein